MLGNIGSDLMRIRSDRVPPGPTRSDRSPGSGSALVIQTPSTSLRFLKLLQLDLLNRWIHWIIALDRPLEEPVTPHPLLVFLGPSFIASTDLMSDEIRDENSAQVLRFGRGYPCFKYIKKSGLSPPGSYK